MTKYDNITLFMTMFDCMTMYTFVYLCVPLFTFVYPCLPSFTLVYLCTNDASIHKFCECSFHSYEVFCLGVHHMSKIVKLLFSICSFRMLL